MGGKDEDAYGQAAGAIGALAVAAGVLAAIKDKLGLSWTATVLLTTGTLVALGYLAWRVRAALHRLRTRGLQPAAVRTDAPALPDAPGAAPEEPSAPVHPELTAALTTAGVIGKDEVIRSDEVTIAPIPTGKRYEFLLPRTRTFKDVETRIANVAGYFGVSRLHVKAERSRDNERRVRLLMLDQPPFTQPFPPPTRQEIKAFDGVPFGHDVTGRLAGVPTLDKSSVLVGGMTQMGKTTLINGLITCLLVAYEEFDLYLLDGKLCGLIHFERACVRYEASDSPAVFESILDDLNAQVEDRYLKMQEALRNRRPQPRFKPVIFIVDEVADFFADDGTPKGKERAQRIAEKARKLVSKSLESGISSIMLTQRPDKDAIPVHVRNQFLIRLCMYVESAGTAKVTLGSSYFDTAAPINPSHLNPDVKGQAVLFAGGTSTLIRGFDFPTDFIWEVVDEVHARQQKKMAEAPLSPLKRAIDLLQKSGTDFMPTADLAPALGIMENRPVPRGKLLAKELGVAPGKDSAGVRGYWLADLLAALKSGS